MRPQQTCRSFVAVAQKPAGPDRVSMSPRPLPQCRVPWKQRTGHVYAVSCSGVFAYRTGYLTCLAVYSNRIGSSRRLQCHFCWMRRCVQVLHCNNQEGRSGARPSEPPLRGWPFSAPVQFDRKQNAQAKGAKQASKQASKDVPACHQD